MKNFFLSIAILFIISLSISLNSTTLTDNNIAGDREYEWHGAIVHIQEFNFRGYTG